MAIVRGESGDIAFPPGARDGGPPPCKQSEETPLSTPHGGLVTTVKKKVLWILLMPLLIPVVQHAVYNPLYAPPHAENVQSFCQHCLPVYIAV